MGKTQCFKLGFFGIDVENKKVELYDEGKGEFTAVCNRFSRKAFSRGRM